MIANCLRRQPTILSIPAIAVELFLLIIVLDNILGDLPLTFLSRIFLPHF